MEKTCNICKKNLPIDDFYKGKKQCKKCYRFAQENSRIKRILDGQSQDVAGTSNLDQNQDAIILRTEKNLPIAPQNCNNAEGLKCDLQQSNSDMEKSHEEYVKFLLLGQSSLLEKVSYLTGQLNKINLDHERHVWENNKQINEQNRQINEQNKKMDEMYQMVKKLSV